MLKGNGAEVVITLKEPGDSLIHIPGMLITEGMTESEIESAMLIPTGLLIRHLVRNGSMRSYTYSWRTYHIPKVSGKIEGLENLTKQE